MPRYFLCAAALIFCCISAACAPYARASSQELAPIVVTKQRSCLFNAYSLTQDEFGADSPVAQLWSLPIDLQSRSLHGGIQTDFSLRGSTFQQVLVALNGQRLNDPQTAHHNSDIPLTQADVARIEVIPGAGSALFGPDALGGVVNFTLKKPDQRRFLFETSAGLNKSGSTLASVTEKKGNLGVRLSIEDQQSGGFRPDTDYKKFTTTLCSQYDLPAGIYELSYGYQQKAFGAYDFYTPGSGYQSREWTRTSLLSTDFDVRVGDVRVKPTIVWRRHYDKFALDKTQVRSTYLNYHRTDTVTPGLYLQKELGILGRMGLGAEYGQENIVSTNLGDHSRAHTSVYMDDSKELGEHLAAGFSLRHDRYDSFGSLYTGSASLKYKLSDVHAFTLGAAKSMRAPSFTELYYSDPITLGDAHLSAEKSRNYQVGYDLTAHSISAGAAAFYRHDTKMIDWVKHSPAQAKWQVENSTDADVCGLESCFKYKIDQVERVDCAYTYTNKFLATPGLLYKYGPNYARHLAHVGYVLDFPWGTQSIGLTYKQKTSRRGWLLLDCRLSRNLNPHTQVFAEATNLLNVEYQEIEGIPQPGRDVQAGLKFEW